MGINKDQVVLFLKTYYLPDEGGFSALPGFKSAPDPTCLGIRALAELGTLQRPLESTIQ